MMDPFVHMHKGTILQESLPGLSDTLVVLTPTDLQKKLLERISENVFEKVHLVSLISAHPSLVAEHEAFSDHKSMLEELKISPEAGVKTQFVIELVRLSKARVEKVLIFSEYIDPLNFLMKQLASHFSWEEGKQVLYMDGKLDEKQRQVVIHSLNADNSEAKVLLASTKACCEGIKSGTMEIERYKRQTKKDRISELVFSSPDGQKYDTSEISNDKILEAMTMYRYLYRIYLVAGNIKSLLVDLKKGVCKDRFPVAAAAAATQQLMKKKFQQRSIQQSLMQSRMQQQQRQNLLQPADIQTSQQAVMQPSVMQSTFLSNPLQNQQSSVQQGSQPVLQQYSQSVMSQQQQ
ncbi:hypothetical protein M9H77_09389 [Catharanthus roseus]|uniref:Uncharacterized protein n=1 Tax=Catharanthus roseus TaxID=4058 RepID=A0ACC0C0G8_CATRO|nr:hypothetical protein M9H77_09389 [Catharanthus roseus]